MITASATFVKAAEALAQAAYDVTRHPSSKQALARLADRLAEYDVVADACRIELQS